MISYEFPLNERVRTLLRLEDLHGKLDFFTASGEARAHHAAVVTLFEILEVAGRADLKSELIQELERQRGHLESLRSNPAISAQALNEVLGEIDQTSTSLCGASGKTGQELRENEWLMGIRQRSGIPGGVCEFDLPSYHYWLHQNADSRRADIGQWSAPFVGLWEGTRIVLKLLRESGKTSPAHATQGVFQQMMGGKVSQMLRVRMDDAYPCVPEVSANKYALNIRFTHAQGAERGRTYDGEVDFELSYCNL
ncbi:MAG: cell division protein ZapD [Betaproteobacteria bacterium]|nr:cell division protein ZapD [Betaproteobacteria bacterium]